MNCLKRLGNLLRLTLLSLLIIESVYPRLLRMVLHRRLSTLSLAYRSTSLRPCQCPAEKRGILGSTSNTPFEGRDTIWLNGIGDLPAVGTIHYVVQGQTVVFRNAKSGRVLANVHFEPTSISQGPEMGNPFPPSVIQGGGWQQDAPSMILPVSAPQATLRLADILSNRSIPHLSFTPCRPDDDGCILSEWVPLTSPSENMQVQISLMLVYSPGLTPNKTALKVFYVGRQGLLGGSNFSYTLNSASLNKCASAVRSFRHTISTNMP